MLSAPFWYRFIYMNISALCQRSKYYLAWQIADLVCNASGLGFNGYDENGKAKWNLCTNVNIIQLETSTSIKHFIDNWNISTQRWIRAVAYERLPKGRTLAAFVLSAMWHGFYPGYYCTFVSGAIFVYAGRVIRQYVRPIFQINDYTKSLYALITWIGTIASINYMALPFVLLGLKHSLQFYSLPCLEIMSLISRHYFDLIKKDLFFDEITKLILENLEKISTNLDTQISNEKILKTIKFIEEFARCLATSDLRQMNSIDLNDCCKLWYSLLNSKFSSENHLVNV
ncbi:unnamed protein product [Brachionus calyciflorus]|uniref:Uncharacterized protein n=1 Tax=Brachionus calyciflorus TaxID=104777 RepID=A0A814C470_9BILA|nr:unnamed protein product [Brachionus calyciflorus]